MIERNDNPYFTIISSLLISVLTPRFLRFHGTGFGSSVLVPASRRYQGFGTRFSEGYLHLSDFSIGSVPFRV